MTMTQRNVQRFPAGAARESSTVGRLTNGLGWFSIGLGLAEVIAPGAVADLIGVRSSPRVRRMLRLYGARELAAGIGILTQPRAAAWVWARVAGDAVDLSSLASATSRRGTDTSRIAVATATVVGITAADVYCAKQLAASAGRRPERREAKVVRSIIVDRSAEDAYRLWHDFENLPRFMTYLQSVRYTGDRRMHWVAKGPAGRRIEWDAEIVIDEPNRMIAWRSVEESPFEHSGTVQFQPAPGGRGTLVRVEVDYSRTRGAAALGKLLKMDLGRRICHDLRSFKQLLEVGEITKSEASIHPGMHPAQPEPVYQY
jgi:uncharacterized membrane protein